MDKRAATEGSDTPRTDKVIADELRPGDPLGSLITLGQLARQLERELAQARADERARCAALIYAAAGDSKAECYSVTDAADLLSGIGKK